VRRGDRLFVTGTLGGPALELAQAERGLGRIRRVPQPRLEAGRALTRLKQIGGCIDISDGLDADLDHLLETTRLAAEVAAERIPLPRGFRAACRKLGLEPERLARTGGEDYELLFSVRAGGPGASALARRLGVAVTEIGRLREAPGTQASRPASAPHGGFRHF
jgi:thiamine-monophosphate kinase